MKMYMILLGGLLVASILVNAQESNEWSDMSNTDSLSYSFGLLIGNNLKMQGIKEISDDAFFKGFQDGFNGTEPALGIEEANNYIQNYFNEMMADEAIANLEKGKAFLEENAAQEGVVTLPSGLQYKILTPGEGESPGPQDKVKVHYTGRFIDGTVFDSSADRNEPIEFQVDGVITGWTEALQLMKPGSKWMLYIPPDLAYGPKGAGGVIGPNETLIFEVELLEVEK